ncbi:MAG: hypothetical protein KKE44_14870 [Proteobacteria bacterium]|nr:hypothetical protein [Pseudomonadota bacterium]MBU1584011.1 hypothetical protein [Pseudomonadota bacterium]MBU2630905.1 hypothetical protein [Pseudomonadota bacterium]
MTLTPKTISVNFNKANKTGTQKIFLDSGRQITVYSKEDEELLEISESDGNLSLEVRLTESGPVISLKGAKLALSAMKEISLEAQKISIHAKDHTQITSQGTLKISTDNDIDIQSNEEIKLKSKLIHLN